MREWLVTDRLGGFAMGTPEGFRRRKYHSFYAGVAGRGECAYLADWDVLVEDRSIWPHLFAPGVTAPEPCARFSSHPFPKWTWNLQNLEPSHGSWGNGELSFELVPRDRVGGMALRWRVKGLVARPLRLRIRPFFALRELHGMGGFEWGHQVLENGLTEISGTNGREVFVRAPAVAEFHDLPIWYRQFQYPEEWGRGYLDREDLFSAGEWEVWIPQGRAGAAWVWEIADSADALLADARARRELALPQTVAPIEQFQLFDPPGVVAGFPWFGEWGRDTFVSLPGIVAASPKSWDWARRVLARWGEWICRVGMLPNLIERDGSNQWESADAGLWWAHALAGLWVDAIGHPDQAEGEKRARQLVEDFEGTLAELLDSIASGRHLFLTVNVGDTGEVLEVVEPQTTWMDARVEDVPITPRTGALPEINALWFQARLLHQLWNEEELVREVWEKAALSALGCREDHRCNTVFLHSIPLAPSFVLQTLGSRQGLAALQEDRNLLKRRFRTPVGLRTLDPADSQFRIHCEGDQPSRDRAYHQGPVWAWLGGHDRMMETRAVQAGLIEEAELLEAPVSFPIERQVPELFDAEAPWTARGAPAQAWSLACQHEAGSRADGAIDRKVSQILSRRFQNRRERLGAREPTA